MSKDKMPLAAKLIGTTLGCGYWPWGPGTMGAIGGVAVWIAIAAFQPSLIAMWIIMTSLIAVFSALGVWAGTVSERYWGPDPSRIVIDETVGQWIGMLPLSAMATQPLVGWQVWVGVALSLAAFRFFDIVKPLGVRRMEQLPGGVGIMADDILAGAYAAIVVLIYTATVC